MAAKTYLKSALTIFAILFLLTHLTFAAPPRYEVIDLGTLGGDWSSAYSINDNGQIVGLARNSTDDLRATLFDPTGAGHNIDLGKLDSRKSGAYSVNDMGQIVGYEDGLATLFDPSGSGSNFELGVLSGDSRSIAYSINNKGQIVGCSYFYTFDHAILFDPNGDGNNIELGTLGGSRSKALSINDGGKIVGWAETKCSTYPFCLVHYLATLFDESGSGRNVSLGTLPGGWDHSRAHSINNNGQIVGMVFNGSADGASAARAVLFVPGGVNIDLGSNEGQNSYANYINDKGQIVGSEGGHAVLFDPSGNGNNIDLNTLIDPNSGWTLEKAHSINEQGWIVGWGYNKNIGHTRAFLMTPVPPKIIYVDDDAPEDPGPGDPTISDPLEDGTHAHPFDIIQEAIDVAWHGDTILVARGIYFEDINFNGKNITLKSIGPVNLDVVQNTTIEGKVCFRGTEDQTCTLLGFNIDGYIVGYDYNYGLEHTHVTISHCLLGHIITPCDPAISACDGTISNCVIEYVGTMCTALVPDVHACHGLIENCTILAWIEILEGGTCTLENCIIYESSISVAGGATLNVSYCDLECGLAGISGGGNVNWGPGNINADPLFVDTDSGDYHLLPASPCINTGDPNYIAEPNETDLDGNPRVINGRIDMGAYEYVSTEIQAEVDIDPNTLNLKSKGRWITAFIWLPEEYDVANIDPNSVFIEEQIKAEQLLVNEQEQVAIARFDREQVQAILNVGDIELIITGRLNDGTLFKAKDIIKVIERGGKK